MLGGHLHLLSSITSTKTLLDATTATTWESLSTTDRPANANALLKLPSAQINSSNGQIIPAVDARAAKLSSARLTSSSTENLAPATANPNTAPKDTSKTPPLAHAENKSTASELNFA